jgi:hypothetical protein
LGISNPSQINPVINASNTTSSTKNSTIFRLRAAAASSGIFLDFSVAVPVPVLFFFTAVVVPLPQIS